MPEYLVPDYFPDFKCKIGACRHVCCNGWPISISMKDYFRLIGMQCNDDLRHRIDVSLHICENPSEDRYAQICPRYDGRCAIMYPDGRCAIHADFGESALPALCRLYPRGVRGNFECSCANSCEAVIEMFLNRDKPLSFKKMQLDIESVPPTETHEDEATRLETRMSLIRLMQDRSRAIPLRLHDIGRELLERNVVMPPEEAMGLDEPPRPPDSSQKMEQSILSGLEMAEAIVSELDEHSDSLRGHGERALEWFRAGDTLKQYHSANESFKQHFPDWEPRMEHILVNQMFFSQFPYGISGGGFLREFIGLCMSNSLMRFLCLGNLVEEPSDAHFADVCAALFRLVSHTDFGKSAAAVLNRLQNSSNYAIRFLLAI